MTNDHLDDYNDTDNNQLRALLDEAESNLEHAKSEQKLAYARGLIRAALMYTTSDPDTAADGIAALIHKEYTK